MDVVETPVDAITPELMERCLTPLSDDHDDKFGVPSLEELGECGNECVSVCVCVCVVRLCSCIVYVLSCNVPEF